MFFRRVNSKIIASSPELKSSPKLKFLEGILLSLFGVVTPFKPDLRIREFEIYKCVYCGLCKELGSSFGPFARLTLTYDASFLSLLELAMSEKVPAFTNGRCLLNPFKKRRFLLPGQASVSAVTGILLLHYKVLDNLKDKGFADKIKALPLLPFTSLFRKRALKRFSHIDASIQSSIRALSELEAQKSPMIDSAAETFAKLMSDVALTISCKQEQKDALSRLGYHLGRWIYIFDALKDIRDDLKKGNYNPLLCYYKITDTESLEASENAIYAEISETLALSLSAAHSAFKELGVFRFAPIIENILSQGMPSRVFSLISKKGECANE